MTATKDDLGDEDDLDEDDLGDEDDLDEDDLGDEERPWRRDSSRHGEK